MSPELEQTWKRTDNKVKYRPICAGAARHLEIELEFRSLVLKTKTYFCHKKVALISIYHHTPITQMLTAWHT